MNILHTLHTSKYYGKIEILVAEDCTISRNNVIYANRKAFGTSGTANDGITDLRTYVQQSQEKITPKALAIGNSIMYMYSTLLN